MNRIFSAVIAASLCLASGCGSNSGHEDHDHEGYNHESEHINDHNHDLGEEHDHEHGCVHDHDAEERHDESNATHNPDEIILTPERAKAAGVKVSTVTPDLFCAVVPASGRVLTASGDESTVVAPAAGIVQMKSGFPEGMKVGKGERILTISSSKLPEGDLSRRNEIAYLQAKSDFERAEKLKTDNLITEKEYLAIKAEYERTKLAYEAAGGKASLGGMAVLSPTGGYIKECLVRDGDYVEVGQPIMRITQNRRLYLRADMSERDYDKIGVIRSAKFRPSYSDRVYDLSELDGRLIASGQTLSSNNSFIPVTFEFDNTGGVVPGSYAEVFLITGQRDNVISVPKTALIEEQGVFSVYLKVDDEGYMKREVKTGSTDGERIEIVSGLSEGEQIVTEGAIHVKLASASAVIPAHNHNH